MSLSRKTIEEFPLRRTTEQLLAFLEIEIEIDRDRKASAIANLGDVCRGFDGR